ncbi:MAG: intracellular septation protein A [Osedax symbiont Rs1]|nr:MAG: intracellular septation protein A [Osedax symbiont Rs1]
MKLFLELFPIIIFFGVYKYTGDIITATAVLIPATILSVGYTWIKTKKIEKMQIVTLVLIIVMGGATVILKDKTFIQWKPSVLYWLFAVVLIGSQFIGQKTIIQRMLGAQIDLKANIWKKLNIAWFLFFTGMGALNLYVVFNYSESTWVDFKLFGATGLLFLFLLLQGLYIYKNSETQDTPPSP